MLKLLYRPVAIRVSYAACLYTTWMSSKMQCYKVVYHIRGLCGKLYAMVSLSQNSDTSKFFRIIFAKIIVLQSEMINSPETFIWS
jgi:uncharacterized membrane protein